MWGFVKIPRKEEEIQSLKALCPSRKVPFILGGKMYLLECISSYIQRIYLIFHIYSSTSYKTRTFGSDRTIMNRPLLGEHSTLLAVSRSPFVGFSWNFTSSTLPQILYRTYELVLDSTIRKAFYLLGCIFSTIPNIFMKIHMCQAVRVS